jgi:MerR family transcriptional regulator, light-induced transcriptional regulator
VTEEDVRKFNIQTAAQLSGLSAHTIRAWEKRYQAVSPLRSDNGRRLYTSKEVDRLIMLAELTRVGTSISQIAQLPDDELKRVCLSVQQNSKKNTSEIKYDGGFDLRRSQDQLLLAVAKYDVGAISTLLSEARTKVEPKSFALQLLRPLILEAKDFFNRKVFQDAQLQALFAIAKFHSGNIIYSHLGVPSRSNQRLILAGIEEEFHSFGLLFTALLCCHHQKQFFYLNSNIPAQSICEAITATQTNTLLLTVPESRIENAIPYLDHIHEVHGGRLKIWIRGDFDSRKLVLRWKNSVHIRSDEELDEFLADH